jgi:NADH-quinone oxidoreductase subunit J
MDAFFFWIFSAGMIISGLAVVLNRNPVASALSFATTIVFMSGLFVLLSAFFLAAVQILITAGAVMVLFLFIIMLLNPDAMGHAPRHHKIWMAASLLLALGFVFLVARTLQDMPQGRQTLASLPATPLEQAQSQETPDTLAAASSSQPAYDKWDDTHQIGRLLFTKYVAPFEVTSLLILVATIGVIVICKQDDPPQRGSRELQLSDTAFRTKREEEPVTTR